MVLPALFLTGGGVATACSTVFIHYDGSQRPSAHSRRRHSRPAEAPSAPAAVGGRAYNRSRAPLPDRIRLPARRRPAGASPAHRGRAAGGGAPSRSRCHRHRQDVHGRPRGRAGPAADPGDRAQQVARRAARQRVPRGVPGQRRRVLRQLLRLLPARGLHPATDTYIEKDSSVNDEIERLRHSATAALLSRRDVLIVASVSCIYGLGSPEEYEGQILRPYKGAEIPLEFAMQRLVDIQYQRNQVSRARGTFRVRATRSRSSRRTSRSAPDRVVGRHDRADHEVRPAHRRDRRRASPRSRSSRRRTTWRARSA